MERLILGIMLDELVFKLNRVVKGIAETQQMAKIFGMENSEIVVNGLKENAEKALEAISETEKACAKQGFPIKIEFKEELHGYAWSWVEA